MLITGTSQTTPAKIGPYQIIRKIGEGGLAEIFLASQESLGRYVAIKVLHPRISDNPELVRRFEKESLTLARLSHPNIVHVIDKGADQDHLYFVMQYVEGRDFEELLRSSEWTREQKLKVVVQILKGLDYAHKNGIVHRDIKPANILIDQEGNALIADFGISQILESDNVTHTETGTVLGTYAYMSPEQKEDSSKVDHTTDIYAAGLILYETLTGMKPVGRFKLPSQLVEGLGEAYDDIVLKALQPDKMERYQKAVEMKDDLLAAMHHHGQRRPVGDRTAKRCKSFVGNCTFLDTMRENVLSATYLVEDRTDRALYVIKKQNRPDIGLPESRLLSNLRHPNVLPLHGAGSDSRKLVILMDYAQGGSLADRMVKPTSWWTALKLLKQIVAGMDFAHKNNIVHGNLKPVNILFDREEVVKIADFGLMSHLDKKGGNPYQPPERRRSRAGDIYAAGVIFYQLLTNRLPTADSSGRFLWVDSHRSIPMPLRQLIERMLKNTPNDRIQTFAEIQEILALLSEDKQVHVPAMVKEFGNNVNKHTWLLLAGLACVLLLLVFYFAGVFG